MKMRKIHLTIVLYIAVVSLSARIIYGPSKFKVTPRKVDFIGEEGKAVSDIMVSPKNSDQIMLIITDITGAEFIALINITNDDIIQTNHIVIYSPFDASKLAIPPLEDRIKVEFSSSTPPGYSKSGNDPLILLNVEDSEYVKIDLGCLVIVKELSLIGRTDSSTPEYAQDEIYQIRTTTTAHFPDPRTNWNLIGKWRRAAGVSEFNTSTALDFRTKWIAFIRETTAELVLTEVTIKATWHSIRLANRFTHCGADQNMYFITRSDCISMLAFLEVPQLTDPKIILGDCFAPIPPGTEENKPITNKHASEVFVKDITHIVCDASTKTIFFQNSFGLHQFSLLDRIVQTVQKGTCGHYANSLFPRLWYMDNKIHCLFTQSSIVIFRTFSVDSAPGRSFTSAISSIKPHKDGPMNNATFSTPQSLAYINPTLYALVDRENNVLRFIEGKPLVDSTLDVYTLCNSTATPMDVDNTAFMAANSTTCVFNQPSIVYPYEQTLFVLDHTSDGRKYRLTSYLITDGVDDVIMTITSGGTNHVVTGIPKNYTEGVFEVSANDPVSITCTLTTAEAISPSDTSFGIFLGCSAVQMNEGDFTGSPTTDFQIHKSNLDVNMMSTTIAEYVPVACQWIWVKENIISKSVIHLKVIDSANVKYNEELSNSNILPGWFEYSRKDSSYQAKCDANVQRFAGMHCVEQPCTICDKDYVPCLHGGTCEETTITCNCESALGYTGPRCEEAMGLCGDLQCLNEAECDKNIVPPSCVCKPGFSGVTCASHDVCVPNPCDYAWLVCEKSTNSKGYNCKDNKFIDDQIRTGGKCNSNDAACSRDIRYSICHPFGFCYCPTGTVKTSLTNEATGQTELQCLSGKVRCRNQQDCLWVSDETGETICIKQERSKDHLGLSTCTCYDQSRSDNVTGRCLALAATPAPLGIFQLIPLWAYFLAVILFIILLLLIYALINSYRQDPDNPKWYTFSAIFRTEKRSKEKKSKKPTTTTTEPKSKDYSISQQIEIVLSRQPPNYYRPSRQNSRESLKPSAFSRQPGYTRAPPTTGTRTSNSEALTRAKSESKKDNQKNEKKSSKTKNSLTKASSLQTTSRVSTNHRKNVSKSYNEVIKLDEKDSESLNKKDSLKLNTKHSVKLNAKSSAKLNKKYSVKSKKKDSIKSNKKNLEKLSKKDSVKSNTKDSVKLNKKDSAKLNNDSAKPHRKDSVKSNKKDSRKSRKRHSIESKKKHKT